MKKYKTYMSAELAAWIRRLISENNIHAFYVCHAWLHLRDEALREQHYECQLCKNKGLYVPATVVHHIKPVRQAPWLALTKSNLLCLCDECHYNIHHRIENKPQLNIERW